MLWTALWIILGLIAALVAVAATRPDTFRVERSAIIAVPPAQLYARLADLRSFDDWSPWAKLDPAMQKTFSGPATGIGSAYAWEGNKNVGAGRMEIIELVPDRLLRMKLQFFRPFKADNEAIYTLEPMDGGTRLTWAMTGPLNLMARVMHLLMNMDRMVGGDFEKGLVSLKRVAEG